MAGEAGSEVKIKVTTEGADQAHDALSKITKVFDGLQGKLKEFSGVLKATGGETGLFSVGVDTLNQAITIFRNPLAGAVAGLVEFKKALHESAEAALANFERMRELTATFGENVGKVSDVTAAYEIAGVSSERLQLAASILGSRAEHAGDSFLKFGINVRNASDELKTPLELFGEVRDKLSQIPNAAERAGAASELFGARQARMLAPALNLTNDAFDANLKKVQKYGEYSEVVHREAERTKKALDELALAQQHNNEMWATTLGLPVEEFFTQAKISMENFKNKIEEVPLGLLSHWLGIDKAQQDEALKEVDEFLQKAAAKVFQMKRERESKPTHLTDEQAKKEIDEANRHYEQQARRLRGDAAYEAQRLRLEEDTVSKGLRMEKEATEESIRLENERFEKVIAAKKRTGFGASGLTPEEEKRLRQQHEDKIYQMELEAKEKDLAIKRAEAQERIKIIEDGLFKEELLNKEYSARISAQYEYERKSIELFASNRAVEAVATAKLGIEQSERETASTILNINRKIDAKRAELEASKGIKAEETRITKEIMALESERTQADIKGMKDRAAARAELLQKMKAMAAEEAGIGGGLDQKAVARLQAKGITEFSQQDVAQERADMLQEAREAHGTYATGGTISGEAYGLMTEIGPQLDKMRQLGTTSGQASAMFQSQLNAQYAGQEFNAIPTGMQSMAPELQAIAAQMKESADSAVERLGATLKDVFEYFIQKFNRKLEFESARQ